MPSRSGFSFTEILFSVIILGIGFIMVAAIFPVAIQQGKLTNEQTVAASVAREALSLSGQIFSNTDSGILNSGGTLTYANGATFTVNYANSGTITLPSGYFRPTAGVGGGPLFPATGTFQTVSGTPYVQPTGNVWSFRDPGIANFPQLNGTATYPSGTGTISTSYTTNRAVDELWLKAGQSLISATDPRYAFVGMYRRDGDPRDRTTWSPFAEVWFIPVTARNKSIYDSTTALASNPDIGTGSSGTAPTQMNLAAKVVQVRIDKDPANANYSTQPTVNYILYNYQSAAPYSPGSIRTGCYVIIARDNIVKYGTPPTIYKPNSGRMNGRIFHVGARRPDLDLAASADVDGIASQAYELQPDGDFIPDAGGDGIFYDGDDIYRIGSLIQAAAPTLNVLQPSGSGTGVVAIYTDASGPADAYVVGTDITPGVDPGPPQDISAFSTFIKVN